jgi:hypothetical protein
VPSKVFSQEEKELSNLANRQYKSRSAKWASARQLPSETLEKRRRESLRKS